jgi:hypothetical protein
VSDTDKKEFSDIIGLGRIEALSKVKNRGITAIRATMEDGKMMMVTQDMRMDRLNVAIEDGVIKSIMGIG